MAMAQAQIHTRAKNGARIRRQDGAAVLETQAACDTPATLDTAPPPGNQAEWTTQAYTATLQFAPPRARIGDLVQVSGTGYPAGADVELVWYTVQGRYELERGTEYVGQRYDPGFAVLTTLRADADGAINGALEVPLDFGGPHDVRGRVEGRELSQASLTIQPSFTLSPASGPVGTDLELHVLGVESDLRINTWQVLYDNRYLGYVSAVTTRGEAIARFRAAGPVGKHVISVWHNSFATSPYLNWDKGPFGAVPSGIEFTFDVTEDVGVEPIVVEECAADDGPWASYTTGPATLTVTPDRGIVGQTVTLRASGLPANREITLRWWTMLGNRVSGMGFTHESRDLGAATSGPDGTLEYDLSIPDDLGGQHRLELLDGGQALGTTGLVIQPSVVSISPTHLRVGEQITIHLKGLGWTTYDNVYAVTYDNAFMGYACGFSTNGDVEFLVTATGQPGTHLIDLYPNVNKGKEFLPQIYYAPHLTYADDHPQRKPPAIRLAIQVVE